MTTTTEEPQRSRQNGSAPMPVSWLLVGTAYLLIPFCLLLPMHGSGGRLHANLMWLAFLLRTFFFHGGLVLVVVAVVATWRRRWKLLALVVPALVVTIGPELVSYLPRTSPQTTGPTFDLMSVNLWRGNQNTKIIDEILAADPDVVFFQEYSEFWHDACLRRLSQRYPHVLPAPRNDSFGSAVFSKLPLVASRDMRLGSVDTPQLRVVVDVGQHQVALYNLHLLSPGNARNAQLNFRQCQELVGKLMFDENLPVVLAGDFNFSQYSRQDDHLMRFGLIESHREVGWGRGATWSKSVPMRFFPGVRIDHVYYSPELTSAKCQRGVGSGSDHRPVIVRGIGWRE